ncbi:MAG: hypothetical protein IPG58_05265 [Acidobacteria bacterium]|nr:hypothetical protein [Acidobacteriota bacterium]
MVAVFAFGSMMLFSGSLYAQKSRASVSGAEVTGTFKMSFIGKKYKGLSNELEILALGGGKLKFAFDLIYPYTLKNGEVSVNMGGLSGEIDIKGDTAVYQSDEYGACKITIKFVRPGEVKVTQDGTDGNCGFGHNVTSQGTYRKVSSKKPKFESTEN